MRPNRYDGGKVVYFLREVGGVGPIKIGYGYDARERLRLYMEWSPVRLEVILTIPGDLKLERAIHNHFAYAHSHSEWFHPVDKLLQAISAMQSGLPVEQAIDLSAPSGSIHAKRLADTRRRRGTSQETVTW